MFVVPLTAGLEPLLGAVECIVSLFSTVEALCLRGVSVPRHGYIPSGGRSSPLPPVPTSLSPPVVRGMASAEIHGDWSIVHGWGCIGGVVVLWVVPLLVIVVLPSALEEGTSGLAVEALEWTSS